MTTILFDLETDGLLDEVSKVHCLCITYPHTEGDDVLRYHDDKDLPRDGTLAEGLDKLREARALIDESGLDIRLEIDGGVSPKNIAEIAAAGADTFVAGSAIFNQPDYAAVISEMREQLGTV